MTFLTNDFTIKDFDSNNFNRYEFTKQKLDPKDYDRPKNESSKEFQKWAKNNLDFSELYEVPMMNALRYYPNFVSFDELECQNTSGNTTLLYDKELECWAVGITGGGINLGPHLLDTFIKLNKGIPIELAENIETNYRAYVNEEQHANNCKILAEAYEEEAKRLKNKAKALR